MATYIDKTANVSEAATIGRDAKLWCWVQVRERAKIGERTILSKGVYVDADVEIGSDCKVQNNVSIYHGVTVEDGVFVGPHVCFTNDRFPRAINPDGSQKGAADWIVTPTRIGRGASLGANATILPGVVVGSFAVIGAGAVVTRDVPAFALVVGNPARRVGTVCYCGTRVAPAVSCAKCGYPTA
jgi:acetyltransferase-like isoleucine patch superfamily enzyme